MAFLDLMLDMHARGELEMSGIQEEVDTFTFEVAHTISFWHYQIKLFRVTTPHQLQ